MSDRMSSVQPTRRAFLATSLVAGGGFALAMSVGHPLHAEPLTQDRDLPDDFEPNAFLRIGTNGDITVIAKHDEMGQGIHTGLAIVVCEELEVDVEDVTVEPAPADPRYGHAVYQLQVTGGSSSTWSSFEQMRRAGATAREMLILAAAKRWGVGRSECEAKHGTVRRRDGSVSLSYGELANDAGRIPVPRDVKLKPPGQFNKIGKRTPRVDSATKVRGAARFSLDHRVPGMLTALVLRPPTFGGTVRSLREGEARYVDGVREITQVPSGVAVIAEGYWPALKAREALDVEWNPGPGDVLDTERLRTDYLLLSDTKGLVGHARGDVEKALENADRQLERIYEVPFQAHAPMEPLNCLVTLTSDGGAHIVTGSQMLGSDHIAVAQLLGVDRSRVRIENSYLGGGFGRRANPAADFVLEAVQVALACKHLNAPIKTVWTREDDIRGGWYRPMFINRMTAGMNGSSLDAWRHRIVGQSIADGTPFAAVMVQNGVDQTSIEGAAHLPYAVGNEQTELHTTSLAVPVQWWRSVGHSNTAFAKESFLDECAEALGRDPYEYRRELLAKHPRLQRVLDLAAEKAEWGSSLPAGVGRGISVHESFKGFAAHVVEASVVDGRPKIHRVVCAIDCGPVINPDQVEAQMQGAAIFSLSATIGSHITFRNGVVQQSNFHDFEILRMHDSPPVEVHIVRSDDAMGGIGEVGVPGIPSAVCTALYNACGTRVRRLPIGDQLGA